MSESQILNNEEKIQKINEIYAFDEKMKEKLTDLIQLVSEKEKVSFIYYKLNNFRWKIFQKIKI